MELVEDYSKQMSELLQLGSSETIDAHTEKPLVSLKILLSVYRRVRTLAEYNIKGKALLPAVDTQRDGPRSGDFT